MRFQHIYSHVSQKTAAAKALGLVEVARFVHKLANLKNQLWGEFEAWIDGNEGADRLADQGHELPPIIEPWMVPACSPAVVVFDWSGCIIGGNIRRKALHKLSVWWAEDMWNKPAWGVALHDSSIDRAATHAALDRSPLPKVRCMANFLHKAHYSMLPVKDTRHHFYWRWGVGPQPVAISPPAEVCVHESRLHTWVVRQTAYQTQECDLCGAGRKEMALHFTLTDKCPHGIEISSATGKDVLSMISAHATKGAEQVAHLPLWFLVGDTPNGLFPCTYKPFTELVGFNKYWGALGYVPKPLNKALDYFGLTTKNRSSQPLHKGCPMGPSSDGARGAKPSCPVINGRQRRQTPGLVSPGA